MTTPTSWVSVARLIRPQGRRGEVLAEMLTDFPERFADLHEAFLERKGHPPAPISIEQSWLHKGRVVLKFAGIDSISAADTLRGVELVIPAEERIVLDEDEVYIGDLIGCQLIDVSQTGGSLIGIVRDVIQQEKTVDLLVVFGDDGAEHWIPFAKAYLAGVDLPARRVEMNLPAGLLDVNAPLSDQERRDMHAAESPGDEVRSSS